jgi:hypothetical protein
MSLANGSRSRNCHASGRSYSPWLRPDAATVSDRSFCHTYGRGEARHQMMPGWPYSIVAAPETGRTSWTAILDAIRLKPGADLAAITTTQVREVVARPPARLEEPPTHHPS